MWKVVSANAGLLTEYEVLQLLRQRGLRTPEEEDAAAERRAASGADAAGDEPAGTEALYPQINAPFAIERAVRRCRARRRQTLATRLRAALRATLSRCARNAAPQVFERLSRGPAAKQDPEKLAQFVALVTARPPLQRSASNACLDDCKR